MEPQEDNLETTAVPSEQENAAPNQTEEQNTQEASSEQEELAIPKKFVGKSPQDIIRSYSELEKLQGRIASEKAHAEKELEAARQRAAALESELQARLQQAQTKPAQEEEVLPDFDRVWNEDPKEAVKKATSAVGKKIAEQLESQRRVQEAQEFYNTQRQANPDFAALEQDMGKLALDFRDIIKPEYLNSKKTLQALFLAAQGARRADFEKRAIESARQKGEMVRAEKRKAFSESASSEGDETVKFEDLSLSEMQKLLGYADK